MDKVTAIKRRAQDLAKRGQFAEAAEEYERLGLTEDFQPYDHVVLGDYLLRAGNRDSAVEQYLKASGSYSEVGLSRNAIALAKKVQRLEPESIIVSLRLGDLYTSENMSSEACLHYLEFLEKTQEQEQAEVLADDIVIVSNRLLGQSLPSFEIVDRLVESVNHMGRGAEIAAGVLGQARQAGEQGREDVQQRLQELAVGLDPHLDLTGSSDTGTDGFLDTHEFTESPAEEPAEAESSPALSLDNFSYDNDPGAIHLEDSAVMDVESMSASSQTLSLDDVVPPEAEDVPPPVSSTPGSQIFALEEDEEEFPESSPGVVSLDDDTEEEIPQPAAPPAPVAEVPPAPPAPVAESTPDLNPDALKAGAIQLRDQGESMRAQREFMKAARAYFAAALSREAAEVYVMVVEIDPNHLDALRGLVEIAHINGERSKMAHWGCELGDVLLAREMYPEAKMQFERVLAFDSDNQKALSRVKRLNTIAGVQTSSFGELAPAASEVQGAKVSVQDDDTGGGGQTELNLAEVLDEFKEAMAGSLADDDSSSHYDLGMTYKGMGLYDEAIEAFDKAAEHDEQPERTLEMLAECYGQLGRVDEALACYERLLHGAPPETQARVYLSMGRAHEEASNWDSAEAAYYRALELDEDLDEAYRRLEVLENRREQGAA